MLKWGRAKRLECKLTTTYTPIISRIWLWHDYLSNCSFTLNIVVMDKGYTKLKNQDLLDRLMDLASRLCIGRKTDPNSSNVKNQLEAIQIEIESRMGYPHRRNGDRN